MSYAFAVFLSSGLLFLLEPMAGKRVLPLLGGSSAVWTACLVFFQAALLAGYLLAHVLAKRTRRTQAIAYCAMLALSVVQLATSRRISLRADHAHPIASVLWLLTVLIGLPFVTLSISGPLLQSWFAHQHADTAEGGGKTYRLYAISNVGSMLALLIYPWAIEPRTTIGEQTSTLAVGVALLLGVVVVVARRLGPAMEGGSTDGASAIGRVTIGRSDLALWILLPACGSLLLSAVTTYISQNVATIPLLWVIPLIAYLLSFIVAFGDERWHPRSLALTMGALGAGAMAWRLYHGDLHTSVPLVVAIFSFGLYAVCMFCHSELYRRRPEPARLTMFYFCLAAGGAFGAMLVGVVAPFVLTGNYEFVLGLSFAGMLSLWATWDRGWPTRAGCAAATVVLILLTRRTIAMDSESAIMRSRNFYGTLQVTQYRDTSFHASVRTLLHGIIEHGQEVFRADLDTTPTTYYGRKTGVGLAISACCKGRPRRIGVIGLGTGTIATYGRPGDVIRFYDINPAVPEIARNYFTYIKNSKARIEIVAGDARLSLAEEPPQHYDVLAIDAFSGDAIPVHLITSEALDVYRRHLNEGGVVAFHISNRYLNLGPVVQQLADHAGMKTSFISSGDDTAHDVFSSDWVLVTNNDALLELLKYDKDHEDIKMIPGLRRWTDEYNSLLPILRVRGGE